MNPLVLLFGVLSFLVVVSIASCLYCWLLLKQMEEQTPFSYIVTAFISVAYAAVVVRMFFVLLGQ